jgi:hypothetical protein
MVWCDTVCGVMLWCDTVCDTVWDTVMRMDELGVSFRNHYVNVPICAPSRSSMWSGRQPHNIPHLNNGLKVGGSWNNYEGVGLNGSGYGADSPGPSPSPARFVEEVLLRLIRRMAQV